MQSPSPHCRLFPSVIWELAKPSERGASEEQGEPGKAVSSGWVGALPGEPASQWGGDRLMGYSDGNQRSREEGCILCAVRARIMTSPDPRGPGPSSWHL